MSEVKIPCLSTPTRGIVVQKSTGEKIQQQKVVKSLHFLATQAMMEQQFPGYYSVYGGVSYPRQYCIIYDVTDRRIYAGTRLWQIILRIIGVPQNNNVYENNLRIIGTISRNIYIGTPEKSELPIIYYTWLLQKVYHHCLTLSEWWNNHIAIADLPAWAATFCKIALIQPSSTTAEHV